MLRYVNPAFPAWKAKQLAESGRIVSVERGIYCNAGTPMDPLTGLPETLVENAFHIALYRYPDVGLRFKGESARRSALGLSPVLNGMIHAEHPGTSQKRPRKLVGPLEIMLYPPEPDAPFHGRGQRGSVMLGDNFFVSYEKADNLQILWDVLRHPECMGSPQDYLQLLDDISPQHRARLLQAPFAQKAVAQWKIMARSESQGPAPIALQFDAAMYLQDLSIGTLQYDGAKWHIRESYAGALPTDLIPKLLMESMMPEGWQEEAESIEDLRHLERFLDRQRRLMNLSLFPASRPGAHHHHPVRNAITDGADLRIHSEHGVFRGVATDAFFDLSTMIARICADGGIPRISGMQPKLPAFLDADGHLIFADAQTPFTLLVKPDPVAIGNQEIAGISVLEWAAQKVSRYAGIDTPESALLIVDGRQTALVSQRFDVPGPHDATCHWALDGAALMGLPTNEKYNTSVNKLWKAMSTAHKASANGEQDAARETFSQAFFDRFAAAFLMGDGDLHIKNVSMLYTAQPSDGKLSPWMAQLAPAYDTVPTRAFHAFRHDQMALTLEGKKARITLNDWKRFGKMLHLSSDMVESRLATLSERLTSGFAALANSSFYEMTGQQWNTDWASKCHTLLENAAHVCAENANFLGFDAVHMVDAAQVLQSGPTRDPENSLTRRASPGG
jgi:serine/threonine-protein kinase HipA